MTVGDAALGQQDVGQTDRSLLLSLFPMSQGDSHASKIKSMKNSKFRTANCTQIFYGKSKTNTNLYFGTHSEDLFLSGD